MKRRQFISLAPVALGLVWLGSVGDAKEIGNALAGLEKLRVYSVEKRGYFESERVIKSADEWRKILSAEQFHVLREQGTEPAYSGKYHDHKEHGVYRCAACELDLYDSATKYDSKSGWPSFYEAVAPENIATREDHGFFMVRNELICRRCESHLGHVFGDGPEPTGKRHCINSLSLTFVKL